MLDARECEKICRNIAYAACCENLAFYESSELIEIAYCIRQCYMVVLAAVPNTREDERKWAKLLKETLRNLKLLEPRKEISIDSAAIRASLLLDDAK